MGKLPSKIRQMKIRNFLHAGFLVLLFAGLTAFSIERSAVASKTAALAIFIDPLIRDDVASERKTIFPSFEDKTLDIAVILKRIANESGFVVTLARETNKSSLRTERRNLANKKNTFVYLAVSVKYGSRHCVHVNTPVHRKEVFSPDDKTNPANAIFEWNMDRLDQDNKKLSSILQKEFERAGICTSVNRGRQAVLDPIMMPAAMLTFEVPSLREESPNSLFDESVKKAAAAATKGLGEFIPQIQTIKH
jgi:hypothetical protein